MSSAPVQCPRLAFEAITQVTAPNGEQLISRRDHGTTAGHQGLARVLDRAIRHVTNDDDPPGTRITVTVTAIATGEQAQFTECSVRYPTASMGSRRQFVPDAPPVACGVETPGMDRAATP